MVATVASPPGGVWLAGSWEINIITTGTLMWGVECEVHPNRIGTSLGQWWAISMGTIWTQADVHLGHGKWCDAKTEADG